MKTRKAVTSATVRLAEFPSKTLPPIQSRRSATLTLSVSKPGCCKVSSRTKDCSVAPAQNILKHTDRNGS